MRMREWSTAHAPTKKGVYLQRKRYSIAVEHSDSVGTTRAKVGTTTSRMPRRSAISPPTQFCRILTTFYQRVTCCHGNTNSLSHFTFYLLHALTYQLAKLRNSLHCSHKDPEAPFTSPIIIGSRGRTKTSTMPLTTPSVPHQSV